MVSWGRRVSLGADSPGSGGDYDPAGVPVRDAATILILAERPDLQVLMLKRNSRSVFVGDMWVYPGGAVDPRDGDQIADDTVAGRTDPEASAAVGVERGGIAFWVAALRETFEEAGVLLAHHAGNPAHHAGKPTPPGKPLEPGGSSHSANGPMQTRNEAVQPGPGGGQSGASGTRSGAVATHLPGDDNLHSGIVDLSPPETARRFGAYRAEVNAGERDFISTMRAEGLRLAGAQVHFVGRWKTPLGPPRRYDTRFFVTAMPQGQVPLADLDEAVEHRWMRPAEAIDLNDRGEMVMMTPTIGMLHRLSKFPSIQAALRAAAAGTPDHDEHVRIRYDDDSPHRIAFPADPDYAQADTRTETGILRWPVPAGIAEAG